METLQLIVGALIAIVSGTVVKILDVVFELKKEKKKLIFDKIQDIIISISLINEGLQQDMATVYNVGNKNQTPKELGFELTKLNCIVKIYHNELSEEVDKLFLCTDGYFNAKREYLNARNNFHTKEVLENKFNEIGTNFELCIKQLKSFVNTLQKYGSLKSS